MSIPAVLYDGAAAPGTEIATVRLTVQRRAQPIVARSKPDGGWEQLFPEGTVSLRLRAVGITSGVWVSTLAARWVSGSLDGYRVAFADGGGGHSGTFMIEQLDEDADAQQRRRFTLVLRSSGPVS